MEQQSLSVFGLDAGDVVTLEHDAFQGLAGVTLQVDLDSVVQDQVHVLVEPGDDALNPGVDILVQPHSHNCTVLEVSKDEVDGLHHHLLNLLSAAVTHSDLSLVEVNQAI